jgi:hypothetical protein
MSSLLPQKYQNIKIEFKDRVKKIYIIKCYKERNTYNIYSKNIKWH